jgi:hypothetical protein
MAKFIIDVIEDRARGVLIEADTMEDALNYARVLYNQGVIQLGHEYIGQVDFELAPDNEELVKVYEEQGEKPVNA